MVLHEESTTCCCIKYNSNNNSEQIARNYQLLDETSDAANLKELQE